MLRGLKYLHISLLDGFSMTGKVLSNSALPMSLRTLKLYLKVPIGDRVIQSLVCLPKLVILHLQGFEIGQNVLSECDNLVELRIVNCEIRSEEQVIHAPKLASLTIYDFKPLDFDDLTIRLVSPNLTVFKIKVGPSSDIPMIHTDEFLLLKTAKLKIRADIRGQLQESMMMNMLQKLCHAQHVALSVPTLELLHQICGTLHVPVSPFTNLKTFKIKGKNVHSGVIIPPKDISISVMNQVLKSIFQSSSDVESFIHLPRQFKRPKI